VQQARHKAAAGSGIGRRDGHRPRLKRARRRAAPARPGSRPAAPGRCAPCPGPRPRARGAGTRMEEPA
jgi:hypothetical protein